MGLLIAAMLQGLFRGTLLTVEVFLHRGFGFRYLNCGIMGIVGIMAFAQCFPHDDTRFLYGYMAAFGVLWLVAGINVLRRGWRGGNHMHCRYSGEPHLRRLLPYWREENVKHLEAIAVILLGFAIHYLKPALGRLSDDRRVVVVPQGGTASRSSCGSAPWK